MNRNNLKLVVLLFAAAAALFWRVANLLYSAPDHDEEYCWERYCAVATFYKTNETVQVQRGLEESIRKVGGFVGHTVSDDQFDEQQIWITKKDALVADRHAKQWQLNKIAPILLGISFAGAIVLFVTQPPHSNRATI